MCGGGGWEGVGGGGELNKWANGRHRTVQVINIRAASESQMGTESRLKSLTDSHPSLTLHQKKIKKEKDKDRPKGTVTSDNFWISFMKFSHLPNSKILTSLCLNSLVHKCPMIRWLVQPYNFITGVKQHQQHRDPGKIATSLHTMTTASDEMKPRALPFLTAGNTAPCTQPKQSHSLICGEYCQPPTLRTSV